MPPPRLAALLIALLPAACTQPGPTAAPPAGAGLAPQGAAGSFDGRYTGIARQSFSRSSACGPIELPQAITVSQGQATYIVDRIRNIVATGAVQPDGSMTLLSDAAGANTVTGRIAGGVFTGEYRSTVCGRTLSLRRQG